MLTVAVVASLFIIGVMIAAVPSFVAGGSLGFSLRTLLIPAALLAAGVGVWLMAKDKKGSNAMFFIAAMFALFYWLGPDNVALKGEQLGSAMVGNSQHTAPVAPPKAEPSNLAEGFMVLNIAPGSTSPEVLFSQKLVVFFSYPDGIAPETYSRDKWVTYTHNTVGNKYRFKNTTSQELEVRLSRQLRGTVSPF